MAGKKDGEKKGEKEKKTVPEADLLAVKASFKKLQEQLAEANTRNAELEAENKGLQVDVGDDEAVKEIRRHLVSEDKEIRKRGVKVKADTTALELRERAVRAKELAAEYGIEESALLAAEDVEGKARDLRAEALAKENEELKKGKVPKTPGEGTEVFEEGDLGSIGKEPKDMTNEEFEAHEKALEAEALAKK